MLIKPNYKILFYISVGIIILLFIWILKDFIWNFFSNLKFHAFPEKFSWFDVFTLVFGTIWTVFVFRIERRSTKNTEIQNQLAFKVNRPVLVVKERDSKNPVIFNNGNFEAVGLKVFYFYYDNGRLKMEENLEFRDKIIYQNIDVKIPFKKGYSSVIFLYKNPASGLSYISGFNYLREEKKVLSIGAKSGELESPISVDMYNDLAYKMSIKNQIYYKTKPENVFNHFLQDLGL